MAHRHISALFPRSTTSNSSVFQTWASNPGTWDGEYKLWSGGGGIISMSANSACPLCAYAST